MKQLRHVDKRNGHLIEVVRWCRSVSCRMVIRKSTVAFLRLCEDRDQSQLVTGAHDYGCIELKLSGVTGSVMQLQLDVDDCNNDML